jgi:hypothetical protein
MTEPTPRINATTAADVMERAPTFDRGASLPRRGPCPVAPRTPRPRPTSRYEGAHHVEEE